MIFGVDVSEWQGALPVEFFADWGFSIVRAHSGWRDDREFTGNYRNALASGKPVGVYGYIDPRTNPGAVMTRCVELARANGGDPALGYWIDYEQPGLTEAHLSAGFVALDALGVKSGYYSNAHVLDHSAFLDRPWWYAAYPGKNDGSYPGGPYVRLPRHAHIWQYTSSNGTLDKNVVLDESWYESFVGAHTSTTVKKKKGIREMYIAFGKTVFGVPAAVLMSGSRRLRTFGGPEGAYGIVQEALDWKNANGRGEVVFVLVEPEILGDLLLANEKVTVEDSDDPPLLTAEQKAALRNAIDMLSPLLA